MIQETRINAKKFAKEVSIELGIELERILLQATKSCLTCTYFSRDDRELCLLCSKRPPARVIAFGCPAYEDELEVPF